MPTVRIFEKSIIDILIKNMSKLNFIFDMRRCNTYMSGCSVVGIAASLNPRMHVACKTDIHVNGCRGFMPTCMQKVNFNHLTFPADKQDF